MNTKIALFGDLHLGLKQDSDVWLEYSKKWIDYFIEKNKDIDTVIFLGDWFHYRDSVSVKTINFGAKLMERLSDNFDDVFVIVGNHDCFFKDTADVHSLSPYSKWSNIHIIDKPFYRDFTGKSCLFVPWGEELPEEKYDYIFGHFEIISFYFNKHKKCENGIDTKVILNKADQIFSGHLHMMHKKNFKKGTITYVGSPFQHDLNDVGNENGFFVLDIKTGSSEFVKNPVGEFPTFHKESISKIDTLIKKKDELKNSFVTIKVDDEKVTDTKIEKVKTILNTKLFIADLKFDLKKFDRTIDDLKISDNIGEVNISDAIEEFVNSMDVKYKDEILKIINGKVKLYEKD